jgi:exosortase O
VLVFILSLLTLWPTLPWWQRRVDSDDWVLASVAALVIAAISIIRQRRDQQPLPVWLLELGSVVSIGAAWWMRVPTIRAAGAVTIIWMALLWWRGASWRQHIPALILAMAALPTRASIDVWCGWPLRRFSAQLAAALLGGHSSESLLAIEGKFVDITEKCAGISSLHILCLLLLTLAVWQQRPWSRVVPALVVAVTVAVVGNAARIVVLAALAGHLEIAGIVHQPLGVLAFAAALGLGHVVMDASPPSLPSNATGGLVPRRWGQRVLGIASLLLVLVPAAVPPVAPTVEVMPLLSAIGATRIELSPSEQALFGGGAVVAKGANSDGVQLLVVASSDPRHHHEPERCLSAGGLSPLSVMQVPVTDTLKAHWVHLEAGDTFTVYVATDRIITDPSARWADSLRAPQETWIGITLLVPYTPMTSTPVTAARMLPALVATAQRLLRPESP